MRVKNFLKVRYLFLGFVIGILMGFFVFSPFAMGISHFVHSKMPMHQMKIIDVVINPKLYYWYAPFTLASGLIGLALGILFDIAKERTAAIKKEQRYIQLIHNSMTEGLVVIDTDCRIINANKAYLDLMKYSLDEIIGKHCYEVSHMRDTPCESEQNICPVNTVIKTQKPVTVIHEHFDREGHSTYVELTVSPILDEKGNIIQLIETHRDITNRILMENELRRINVELEERVLERTRELENAQEQLLQSERLATIGQLAGSVAHDIRNPIGSVSNSIYYLNRISDEKTDIRFKKHLEFMSQEISRTNDIITDLLNFSRENIPIKSKGDINNLIEITLNSVECPEHIIITKHFDINLPYISFDPTQMQRVFQNLIYNAQQAMTDGGELEIITSQENGWVLVQFNDTGSGIPQEKLEKIFDPLFTTKSKGVGLGLTIVKNLIEKHDGTIEVESKPGKGSSFKVILPQ